ncbi:MAG: low temperature requirement protein A [Rhodobacterales bacterium]|nr:low temperature requirement protein A [Rhodobacterales bacterium]
MRDRPGAILPMPPRDPEQRHRAATPLELLFDLVSVVAIAAAAAGLHHAIAEGHALAGVPRYFMTFFIIWWAWMNFTWFASAYDNDDAPYRVLTMVMMAGALVIAAGTPRFFNNLDIGLLVIGYVVMRLGLVALWLRAMKHDRARRATTLRYAVGIVLAQAYWIGLYVVAPAGQVAFVVLIVLGFAIELAVPAVAERASATPWHRHHIIERYGLLTIIVLGEVLLSSVQALQAAWDGSFDIRLVHVALSALVITFAMWWMYFSGEEHLQTTRLRHALRWGYGHVVVFASGAAVGAGFAVLVEVITGHAHVSLQVGDLAVALPLACYMLGLWFVRDSLVLKGPARWVLPVFAGLTAALPFAFPALEVIAALAVAAVALRAALRRRVV